MTKPLYFYNGTTFELVGPTTPQSPIAYQTSAPTAPATGDLWIDSDGDVDTYNRQLTRYYYVATAAQTTITGIDANGLTLAYVAGSEAVYVNGALQVRGVDYTATNGTSITGLSALAVNDVVEIFAYTAFTVANAYTKSETDGVAAAAAGLRMVVPSSVAVGSGTGSVNAAGFVTFSSASSVSLNDVFSSTYDNYRIVTNILGTTNGQFDVLLRFRVSGADNSSATYERVNVRINSTITPTQAGSQTSLIVGATSTIWGGASIDIAQPNLARRTHLYGQGSYSANTEGGLHYGFFNADTVFTGFSLIAASGNLTGSVAVYGYKD